MVACNLYNLIRGEDWYTSLFEDLFSFLPALLSLLREWPHFDYSFSPCIFCSNSEIVFSILVISLPIP